MKMKNTLLVFAVSSAFLLSACSSDKKPQYTVKPFSETVMNTNSTQVKYNRVINYGDFQVVEYQDLQSNTVDPTQTVVVVPALDKRGKGAIIAYSFDRDLVRKYIKDPKKYVLTTSKAFNGEISEDNPAHFVTGMDEVKYATMQVVGNQAYMKNSLFKDNVDTVAQAIQDRLNTSYPGAFHIKEVKLLK